MINIIVVKCTGSASINGIEVAEVDKKDLRKDTVAQNVGSNKDGESICTAGIMPTEYYQLNTSGAVVRTKKAAKDGDDWDFYVKEKHIMMYTNNKVLATGTKGTIPDSYNNSKVWADDTTIYEPIVLDSDLDLYD